MGAAASEAALSTFDRLLRYVSLTDGTFVNEEMVRLGWAEAADFPPDSQFASLFASVEADASAAGRGTWDTSNCAGSEPEPPPPPPPDDCDPSYPTVRIPSPPPDLDVSFLITANDIESDAPASGAAASAIVGIEGSNYFGNNGECTITLGWVDYEVLEPLPAVRHGVPRGVPIPIYAGAVECRGIKEIRTDRRIDLYAVFQYQPQQ